MNDGYKSVLTREQLIYNILYQRDKNPTESLRDTIEKVLKMAEYKKSSN